ncbi:hypothetical protein V8C86DRAFT_1087017 [Haematococcus lacustris]
MEALGFSAPAADPQALANTLWALAKMRLRPDPHWLQLCLAGVSGQVQQLEAQHLTNILYACARLDLVPPLQWLTALLDQSAFMMPWVNLATPLAAMPPATPGPASPADCLPAAAASHDSSPSTSTSSSSSYSQVSETPDGDAHSSSCSSGGGGGVPRQGRGIQRSASRLHLPAAAAGPGSSSRGWQGPADQAGGGEGGGRGQYSAVGGQQQAKQAARGGLGRWCLSLPQQYANLVFALGSMRYTPSLTWWNRYFVSTAGKLQDELTQGPPTPHPQQQQPQPPRAQWQPQHLANTALSVAKCRVIPPRFWRQIYEAVLLQQVQLLTAQEAVNSIFAYGRWGLPPKQPTLLRSLLNACWRNRHALTLQGLANLVWALARMAGDTSMNTAGSRAGRRPDTADRRRCNGNQRSRQHAPRRLRGLDVRVVVRQRWLARRASEGLVRNCLGSTWLQRLLQDVLPRELQSAAEHLEGWTETSARTLHITAVTSDALRNSARTPFLIYRGPDNLPRVTYLDRRMQEPSFLTARSTRAAAPLVAVGCIVWGCAVLRKDPGAEAMGSILEFVQRVGGLAMLQGTTGGRAVGAQLAWGCERLGYAQSWGLMR